MSRPRRARPRYVPIHKRPEARKRLLPLQHAFQQGHYSGLEEPLRELATRFPELVEVEVLLAEVLAKQGRWKDAYRLTAKARKAFPSHPSILSLATRCLEMLEDPQGSERALAQLLAKNPNDFNGLMLRLTRARKSGNRALARRTLDKLLRQAPDHPHVLYQASMLQPLPGDHPAYDILPRHLFNPDQTLGRRIMAGFALGNLHLQLGNDEEAFAAYSEANRLAYPMRHASAHPATDLINWHSLGLSPEYYADRLHHGANAAGLIMVLGASRSGKSLVESLLVRHPKVAGAGESLRTGQALNAQLQGDEALTYMNEASAEQSRADASAYLEALGVTDDAYRVDTLPDNLMRLPMLALWCPNAPLIFCQRHPLDQGISIYFRNYGTGNKAHFDLHEIGHYLRTYKVTMTYFAEVLPNPVHWVDYEQMVLNPITEARRLYDFLGLDYPEDNFESLSPEVEPGDYRLPIDSFDRPVAIEQDGLKISQRFERHLDPLKAGWKKRISLEDSPDSTGTS